MSSGFIGKKLVQELAKEKDNTVIAVVRNEASDVEGINCLENVEIVFSDMCNISCLPKQIDCKKADYFFHLAWEGSTGVKRDDYDIQIKNVKWSLDAFKVAEKTNCEKFLCAGTISECVLGQISSLEAVSQNMIYAQAKKTLYEFLQIESKNSRVKPVWMQFSNVYGPGNKTGNLIGFTMNELMAGRIPEYGPAMQPYNFVYIDDLIAGICGLAGSVLRKDKYFIGSDEVRILKEYLNEIPEILQYDVALGIGKKTDDGITYDAEWFDTTDLKEDTGYKSKISFRKGIELLREERRAD